MGLPQTIAKLNETRTEIVAALNEKGFNIPTNATLIEIHNVINQTSNGVRIDCYDVEKSSKWGVQISEPGSSPENNPSSFKTVDFSNIYWRYSPSFGQQVVQAEQLLSASVEAWKSEDMVWLRCDVSWANIRDFSNISLTDIVVGVLSEDFVPNVPAYAAAVLTNIHRDPMDGLPANLTIGTDGVMRIAGPSPSRLQAFNDRINRACINACYAPKKPAPG